MNADPPAFSAPGCSGAIKPHKPSLSEWYWLEISSAGSPCASLLLLKHVPRPVLCLQSYHSFRFSSSFLVSFEDKGLLVSCVSRHLPQNHFALAPFSGVFNFKDIQASVQFGRFSALTCRWKVGSSTWVGDLQLIIKSAVLGDCSWGVQWLLCYLMR